VSPCCWYLAAPFLGVHVALPDAGNDPEGTSSRQAYDRLADGFGAGANGPLLLVADLSRAGDEASLQRLRAELGSTAGVAAVSPPRVNPAGDLRTRDNGRAIVTGLAGTGRVITAAAAIMIVVFAAFIPSDQVFIKVFAVGMVAAILVDATIIRMLLVPAVMHLLGRGNWWLPSSVERRLPPLHVEGPVRRVIG
jgi:uncharacterized membrane protein YdfJ with MMPL/SSD domain